MPSIASVSYRLEFKLTHYRGRTIVDFGRTINVFWARSRVWRLIVRAGRDGYLIVRAVIFFSAVAGRAGGRLRRRGILD
jgi:hypothetical protein